MMGLRNLWDSSTFWAGLIWTGLWVGSNALGANLPIEVLYVMVGVYGVKEAAGKLRKGI